MTDPLHIAGFAALGLALGVFYFLTMRRTVRLHTEHAPAGRIVAHYAVRIVAAVAVFLFAARAGSLPLLVTFAGFIAARMAVLRRVKGEER